MGKTHLPPAISCIQWRARFPSREAHAAGRRLAGVLAEHRDPNRALAACGVFC